MLPALLPEELLQCSLPAQGGGSSDRHTCMNMVGHGGLMQGLPMDAIIMWLHLHRLQGHWM